MGLRTDPATFQSLMNSKPADILEVFPVAYLDDLIIYNETTEQHLQHVEIILLRPRYMNCTLEKISVHLC